MKNRRKGKGSRHRGWNLQSWCAHRGCRTEVKGKGSRHRGWNLQSWCATEREMKKKRKKICTKSEKEIKLYHREYFIFPKVRQANMSINRSKTGELNDLINIENIDKICIIETWSRINNLGLLWAFEITRYISFLFVSTLDVGCRKGWGKGPN